MKQAIVTIVEGEKWHELYDTYFYAPMQAYADRCGVELLRIDKKDFVTLPRNPSWKKCLAFEQFSMYDRLLYLDADILVTHHAPDIFALADASVHVAAVTENANGTTEANIEHIYRRYSLPLYPVMLNCGVLMLKNSAKMRTALFSVFTRDAEQRAQLEATLVGWYEQPYLSSALLEEFLQVPQWVSFLPVQWNKMVYRDMREFGVSENTFRKIYDENYFIHLAGAGKDPQVYALLQSLYRERTGK